MTKPEQSLQELLIAAHSCDRHIAVEAIRKLGVLQAKEAAPIIIARMADEDAAIRQVCTEESIDILGNDATALLEGRLLDESITVGMIAAGSLAYIGTPVAAKILIRAVENESPIISTHGRCGLGSWKSLAGFDVFTRALIDGNANVRGHAALALGRIGDAVALPYLALAFDKEHEEVNSVRIATAQTLLGEDKKILIRQALHAADLQVQFAALACVATIKDRGALFDILPLLGSYSFELAMTAESVLEELELIQKETSAKAQEDEAKLWLRLSLPDGYIVGAEKPPGNDK